MGHRQVRLGTKRWRDWSLAKKGAAVVALPLALLLAALYSNYTLQRDVSRADEDVQRTLTVRADIQALHTLIAEAASGVRGYLLTGREEFLSPYWMAQERIPQTLKKLRETIRDAAQAERLERAAGLVAVKLAGLEELRLNGAQLEPAALQSHLRSSKQVLDTLRSEIIELGEGEARLIADRIAAAGEARRRESIANVVMAVIGLAGAAVALWLLTSGIIRRVQTVATNAERLASGLPLMPPPVARDEVGLLAERLHRASLLLAERADQARAANLAKTEFLSRTSHELRTPLNVILGFAQLLESDLRGTPSAGNVVHVLGAGRHLLSLIDEMLDISSIESGTMKLQHEVVVLEPLLREALALVEPLASRSGVRLELGDPAGVAVYADRQRLRQVMLNLLTNAVKFNKPGGTVTLAVERRSDRVRISIADTGVGIRPEDLGRLFSPFERLDAEKRGIEGTGLGLAISQQLVKRMQGNIDVTSEPDHGSVFSVTLASADPASVPVEVTQAAPVARLEGSARAPLSVLYVEDNGPNIALIQALMVRRPQWQLHVARTAEEGMQQARGLRPDLVLIDLHLPDQSGEVVLQSLRADAATSGAVFAILSADAVPATIDRLRACGAAEYMTKPIDVSRFFALLDRVAA